ncbi:hypothetical protein ACSQ67_018526 [Phaseolus vulgaris]
MAPNLPPPPINIEPEYFLVMQWYYLTSLPNNRRKSTLRRELSLHANKHLLYLGWKFWELRYTSPSGKNYIYPSRACKGCIEEDRCKENPQNL